jgi:GTP cyclohydrolase II
VTSITTVSHELHLGSLGNVVVHVGRLANNREVLALCYGEWDADPRTDPVLVRIQSSCVYGVVLGSRDCDCRQQLDNAIEIIRSRGAGVIVHLDQEGRDAGLFAKAREHVRRTNVDAFTAYEELGLPVDARDYTAAIELLRMLHVENVSLLTNNPTKLSAFANAGFTVTREPLVIKPGEENRAYLESKRRRGHLLD